jgi:hypothetical protein
MVAWYDPGQLLRTGLDMVVSTIFASKADRRLTDAIATGDYGYLDYASGPDARESGDFVADFVADAGDGWNSTFAVAQAVTRPLLPLADPAGRIHTTRRGDLLVFGGDEVYPAASAGRYRRRLLAPYRTALPWTQPPHPDLFAIPGNHDWFDNLVAFGQLFVAREWLGGWRTRQERSYFACKLPRGWWLVGADVQLESDIDQPQVDFFRKVAGAMAQGDQVILCTAEPHWVYEHEALHPHKRQVAAKNLRFLEERVFGNRVRVFLSGDQHHYRRHALADGSVQKITAGGGGAFLHPTHGWRAGPLPRAFRLEKAYPTPARSWFLGLRNLLFPIWNPTFALLTGLSSLLVYMSLASTLAAWHPGPIPIGTAVLHALPVNSGAALAIALVLGGFLAFTDTSSRAYRVVGGLAHGAAHLALAFLTACGVRAITATWTEAAWWVPLAVAPLAQAVVGGLAGSLLMGFYLFVSLNLFGRHRNEAFSSLRIPDYKNFLRLRIDAAGRLEIYPVCIDRVPRAWVESIDADGAATLRPAPGPKGGTGPRLIEEPICLPGPAP